MAFICFEGLDGAGKTTLIQLFKNALTERDQGCVVTREPGGTALGDELRTLLLRVGGVSPHPRAEILLYEAIRAQHVEEKIRPALENNQWVLCDRFTASSLAFQAAGRALVELDIRWLNQFATAGLTPHLQVLLDLPLETSRNRLQSRRRTGGEDLDRFENEPSDFHGRVRLSFLEQAQKNPHDWLVLDALQPPIASFQALLQEIQRRGWLE